MNIVFNGKPFYVEKDITLSAIVESKGFDSKVVVCELNREIIAYGLWGMTILQENDKLEVISFVGGG